MKQLVRTTAVAIGIGIGIVSFGGVADVWDESASAHSACVGGVASITVTFTNVEPSTGDHAMVISASDEQSHGTAVWGNGESDVTVPGGQTVTGTITTHMASVSEGSVRITERWANGSEDHDVVVVAYESRIALRWRHSWCRAPQPRVRAVATRPLAARSSTGR